MPDSSEQRPRRRACRTEGQASLGAKAITDEMQEKLHDYCERAFPPRRRVRVSDLVERSPGWESRIFAFQLKHGTDEQRRRQQLVLRLHSGGDVAHTGSAHEFSGMRWLFETGYPAPEVLILERDDSPLGQPFVITGRIDGRVLWTVLRGPEKRIRGSYWPHSASCSSGCTDWNGGPSCPTRRCAT